MSKETAGNAMARGPPSGRWASVTRRGRHAAPQFIIIHHASLAAAAEGRSGTFLDRPVFVAADRAQPSNHNRNKRKLNMKAERFGKPVHWRNAKIWTWR